jgi:hypothetical protein
MREEKKTEKLKFSLRIPVFPGLPLRWKTKEPGLFQKKSPTKNLPQSVYRDPEQKLNIRTC